MECKVLIVEDDVSQLRLLKDITVRSGFTVYTARTVYKAKDIISKTSIDVVVSDVRLPDGNGLDLLKFVKATSSGTEFIVITAFADVSDAVSAIKTGAFHYLVKPFDPDIMLNLLKKACELAHLRMISLSDSPGIVYASKKMEDILKRAEVFSKSDAAVLILGESGVGKERLARFIFERSGRKGSFVPVNCAALPDNLFESELFGYEKGAFTGAFRAKRGLIEEADGGVLFLDEVGEMPVSVQAKLLRFLEEGEVRRLGSTVSKKVDVKVVAATNANLYDLVRQGKFREDLYFRLSVLVLEISPLRERKEDIVELVGYFLKKFSKRYRKDIFISDKALEILLNYDFPGNVRELENIIHRAVLLADDRITEQHIILEKNIVDAQDDEYADLKFDFSTGLKDYLERVEKAVIKRALEVSNYVQTKAAKLLDIDEKTLRYKRKKYNI